MRLLYLIFHSLSFLERAAMYEILPNLFLSNFEDAQEEAKSISFFQINVTKDLPMLFPTSENHRIPIHDDQSPTAFLGLLMSLKETMEVIDKQLQNGNKVVIHCLAGQQRSAAVAAAYLLHKNVVATLQDAIMYLRDRKKDAFFWSVNFRQPLEIWASALRS